MKKLVFAAAMAAMCVAFGQAPASAPTAGKAPAPMPRMIGPRGGMHGVDQIMRMVSNPKFAEQIGLSAEQKAKIAELQKAQREEMKKTGEAMRAASMKKAQLLSAEKVDEAAVMAAIDESCEVRKQMEKAQAKKAIAVKALLTPEQISKALAAMKDFRSRPPARHRMAKPGEAKPSAPVAPAAKPAEAPAAAPAKK